MTKKERYVLTQSKEFFLKANEEVRIDLKLKRKPNPLRNRIAGKVYCKGHPVPQATVKVLDHDFNPIEHAKTNEEGIYWIDNLMPGEYKITATAPGFLVADIICFSLAFGESKIINISIKKDKLARENSFIYGTILERIANKPVENAEIKLFSTVSPHPYAEASSNESGQYLLCTIPPGEYFMIARKKGFLPSDPIKIIVIEGHRIKVNFLLQTNDLNPSGTVNGIIKNHYGEELADVCVGLFGVDQDEEILIETKSTNSEGLYLFSDVPPGKYWVKAKIRDKWEYTKEFELL